MNKRSYMCVLNMLFDHPVFHNNSPYPHAEVFVQLAVTLDLFGHEGNGACLDRTMLMWGLSHDSMVNYTNRVMTALESAMGHEIAWPDHQERVVNSAHFVELGFLGCLGLVDGTLVKLSQRPRDDGETYFDRKSNYSMNVQIIYDQNKRVIYFFAGMHGSCHDLSCLRLSSLWGRWGLRNCLTTTNICLGTADISFWIALCAHTREPVATWTRLISIHVLLMRE
ncbi:hypothetical protein R1sor_020905 [Riccia sorocarpa]|uniref:DDE Tnp4 domain-containing protein n=1 Tax=Riccia sorocarpa TaxID=122646 RepID=A0ABD3GJR1_9MARC